MKQEILDELIEVKDQLCEELDALAKDRFSNSTFVSTERFKAALATACDDLGVDEQYPALELIEDIQEDIANLKVRAFYMPTNYQVAFGIPMRSPEDAKRIFSEQASECLGLIEKIEAWVEASSLERMLYEKC